MHACVCVCVCVCVRVNGKVSACVCVSVALLFAMKRNSVNTVFYNMLVLIMRCVQLKLVCGTAVAEFDMVNTLPDIMYNSTDWVSSYKGMYRSYVSQKTQLKLK
jgi:hypothetical protein